MPRTTITIVLIAATLIGPCLCCCAFATFFAAPNQVETTPIVTAPTSEPDEETACPFCRKSTTLPKFETPKPTQPTPPKRHCPCCDDRAKPSSIAEIPQPLPVVDVLFLALLPVDLVPAFERSIPPSAVEYPPGMEQRIFLSDFCHRLRC